MKASLLLAVAVLTLAAAVALMHVELPPPRPPVAVTHAEGTQLLARLPVAFVPNVGQWEHSARYLARFGAMSAFLADDGWTFTREEQGEDSGKARGVAVRMTFAGARDACLVPEERLPGRHNYFLGNDPSRWRSDVPLYAAVRYRGVQPGIDVRAREQNGHFEYDLLLEPGADLDAVEIAVAGIERMHIDPDRALVLETALGPVRMPAPRTWEEEPSGEKSPLACRYVLLAEDRFAFEAPGRRPGWALVVDPGLVWSTLLGGTNDDGVAALALDARGAATVAGMTKSADFPFKPGAYDTTHNGSDDAFVAQLSPEGSRLIYATFLGGSGSEYASGLALDAQGAATITGTTLSTNFPTTSGAYDRSHNGVRDAFVARLSATGSTLVFSTLLGGRSSDAGTALAVDAQGAATVVGTTYSTDFPATKGAYDTTHNGGGNDGFVARLSASGSSLVYSTFLGGIGYDWVGSVAVDAQGAATVAGSTYSVNLPTTPGAFDTTHNGTSDAFVARLSPSGSSLIYATFLGGTREDGASALALDAQGAATVAGSTYSGTFPTTRGAFDPTHNGSEDAFVARLSPSGARLVYATFVGGTSYDRTNALALDARGAATVVGQTWAANFPTTPGAFDRTYSAVRGQSDGFVARLSPSGSSLVYSTYLGGPALAASVGLDAQGAATVAGWTSAVTFPTTPGAYDTTYNGGTGDAFVTRLDMLPAGVAAFGVSSPGCTGPLAISVTSMPSIGNAGFGFTCSNAPPNGGGGLGLSGARLQKAFPVLGAGSWIDLTSPIFLVLPVTSNSVGAADLPMPVPPDPKLVGVRFYAQFFWVGPTSPRPCPPLGVSASHALDVTIRR